MKKSLTTTRPFSALVLATMLLLSTGPAQSSEIIAVVAGRDAGCARATDAKICEAMSGCQPSFEDQEIDLDQPIYTGCIATPRQDDEASDPEQETVEAAAKSNCQGIDDDHLYIRHIMETTTEGDSKKVTTTRELKLKVCHPTGNSAAHTIITECASLKSHVDHQDDYIGACHFN